MGDTNELLQLAAKRAAAYLEGLDTRSVAPSPDALTALEQLYTPLPDRGIDPEDVLRRLDAVVSPATVASAGPRYFGFVTGGALPASLAASFLANAWDQNAHFVIGSPAAAALEDVALRWILEILGLPPAWSGGFVTGTTMGNFAGLAAARHAVLARAGWDVESEGLFGAPPVTVLVGAEAHSTLFKALGLLGLGRHRVVTVPVDGEGRLRADALPAVEGPTILCLQAGNVNSGGFDPIAEVARRVRGTGAWVHVDGAFGLWAAASPRFAHLVEGLDAVDSIATDLHKWPNVPYDSGLALYRDREAARRALSMTAAYLPGKEAVGETRQPCDFTPESSRRARGVEIWAAIASLGRSGLAELVERCCRHAQRFAAGLEAAGFEVLNDVVLNQVLVAFGDDDTTARVIRDVQAEGTCWCGASRWKGRTVMRISLSSWATRDDDVERSLEAIRSVARRR